MYKSLIFVIIFLFLSSCNKHSNVIQLRENNNNDIVFQEKPFEIKWKIEKNSITNIPLKIKKILKHVCKNHNRFVLTKIKTFKDDTVLGTFDCRI